MTMTDKWLLEQAHKRKALKGAKPATPTRPPVPPIDDLWSQLQTETKRQVKVFTEAVQDARAITIETQKDSIDLKAADGRRLEVLVDRERRRLTERFRDRDGKTKMTPPIIHFTHGKAGEAAFNFGNAHTAATSLLRRLI